MEDYFYVSPRRGAVHKILHALFKAGRNLKKQENAAIKEEIKEEKIEITNPLPKYEKSYAVVLSNSERRKKIEVLEERIKEKATLHRLTKLLEIQKHLHIMKARLKGINKKQKTRKEVQHINELLAHIALLQQKIAKEIAAYKQKLSYPTIKTPSKRKSKKKRSTMKKLEKKIDKMSSKLEKMDTRVNKGVKDIKKKITSVKKNKSKTKKPAIGKKPRKIKKVKTR